MGRSYHGTRIRVQNQLSSLLQMLSEAGDPISVILVVFNKFDIDINLVALRELLWEGIQAESDEKIEERTDNAWIGV